MHTMTAKLTRIYLIVVISVLLSGGLISQLYIYYHARTVAHENIRTQAVALAGNLESAVTFGDVSFAQQTLNALQNSPDVLMAAVILPDGQFFARYATQDLQEEDEGLQKYLGDFFDVFHHGVVESIARPGEAPARLVLVASLARLNEEMLLIFFAGLAIGLLILYAAFSMFRQMSRAVTRPIEELTQVMRSIECEGDHGQRTTIVSDDEIGELAQGFNAMLVALEKQNSRLSAELHERKKAMDELRIAAVAFESQDSMVVTDAQSVILRVNRAFTRITGYSAEDVVWQRVNLFQSDRHNADFYRVMWEHVHRTGGWQGEIWDKRKNGEMYPTVLNISAVKGDDDTVTHYIWSHQDISGRKKAEEKINELAFYDQLTGLPNRSLLLDRLKLAMSSSSRNDSFGALLFIDLDNFKTLNDTLGHDMGDLLLQQVGQRLKHCIRTDDTVARLGGDEFVVMLTSLSPDERVAASQARVVGEKILAALNQTYQLNDVAHHSTPSIGATLFNGQQTEIEVLLKQADLAMYKSKDAGRNAIRFFDPDMAIVVMKRAAMENSLRQALLEQQFLLHYQAQVAGGKLTGAEVLVRWQHPEHGMVQPYDFIPLAEETGLILPLGQWVMETACIQLAEWAKRPEASHLTIAVNVSAHQFRQSDFVNQVLGVLRNTGANPQRLKLELTESMLVANVEDIIAKMAALKAEGVGFSLDDFGTGYSSLTYLKRLPLDQLKIDQSFVRDILVDANDASIAKTIITLAQSLGLGVIAEGVETAEQKAFLASVGCHAYQGYFFSRPVPIEGFEKLMKVF